MTPQGTVVFDKSGALQVVAQDNTDTFLVNQDPAEQPMAPADPYQMPTTSSLTESIDRQLAPVFSDGITTDQCQLQINDNPIYLDNYVQVPGQITFDLKQVWKEKKHISWIAVDYEYRRAYSCNDITRNPCSTNNLGKYFEADAHNRFIHCGAGNIYGTPEQYRESSCNLKPCGRGTIWDQDLLVCVHGTGATKRPGSKGGRRCKKKNKVKFGFDKRMDKFTAMCEPVTNKATIDIYLFDGSNGIRQADEVDRAYLVPGYCSPSNGKSIKSWSKTKSSKGSRRRRLAVEEEADEDIEFFGRRNRRLGASSKGTKSGTASSATKNSAGKEENNVCLYQYVVDCVIASGRRRLQSLEPPPMFYPQQLPPVPQDGYPQTAFPQEYHSPAPHVPQQQRVESKHRRSLFSRASSIFKASDAHRRDRSLQVENQELPLFGGPKVLGTCPKGVSKRTGEIVFNRYLFG